VAVAEQVRPLVTIPAAGAEVAATAYRSYASAALFLWFCGCAAIAACWATRWKRMQELRMRATPLRIRSGIASAVPIMSAPGLVEPGVFGVFRPVLLLPAGIAERLNQSQLEAILAHELCHVRRRDNLTAAIHMAVQAAFWFHPLVWWLGARLVDERERACDEEVLRLGNKPQVYAEGILRVCKLYVESRPS
jgi:beta-lactamase regulating signal transducer with metallopeptidase domain